MNDFLLMLGGAVFAMVISGIVNYKKSQWVGLTDEEIEIIYAECNVWDKFEYERMLETRLKEKNT